MTTCDAYIGGMDYTWPASSVMVGGNYDLNRGNYFMIQVPKNAQGFINLRAVEQAVKANVSISADVGSMQDYFWYKHAYNQNESTLINNLDDPLDSASQWCEMIWISRGARKTTAPPPGNTTTTTTAPPPGNTDSNDKEFKINLTQQQLIIVAAVFIGFMMLMLMMSSMK